MAAPRQTPFKLGEWRVDPSLDEITREGKTVKLEPRAMGVLVCLADHAGHVVSVDQLLDTVWKDVVVTPDSVYQAVAVLRKALRDDTKEPTYIANVLRRGYRLVAPVSSLLTTIPLASQLSAGPGPPTQRPRPTWVAWIALAVAFLVGGGFVARGYVRSHEAGSPRQTNTDTSSIAVLPFLDLSSSKDQQYFADGLSDELIERLVRVPGLRVVARSSSFYFKGRQVTVAQIASTLGVAYLLEGSVRKSGETLRITAHLVRAHDAHDLWSETYERPMKDVFRVQDEIAGAVVQAMDLSILISPLQGIPIFTTNADAHMVYLQALAHVHNATAGDYDAAESELHSALTLDPQFATAWALLSMVTVWRSDGRAAGPTVEACTTARDAATRALEINGSLWLSHRANGIVLQYCDGNFPAAETEFNRALELHPNNPLALMSLAHLAHEMGQAERAIGFAHRATESDPLNFWTFSALGDVSLNAAEAETAYRRAVNIDSSAAFIHSALAITLLTNHKPLEAVAESEQEPDPQYRAMMLPIVLDATGHHSEAEQQLAELKLHYGDENADWIGLFYACRHDTEHALQWLGAYAANHTRWMEYQPYLRECLKSLTADPRYRELDRKMMLGGGKPKAPQPLAASPR